MVWCRNLHHIGRLFVIWEMCEHWFGWNWGSWRLLISRIQPQIWLLLLCRHCIWKTGKWFGPVTIQTTKHSPTSESKKRKGVLVVIVAMTKSGYISVFLFAAIDGLRNSLEGGEGGLNVFQGMFISENILNIQWHYDILLTSTW